MAFALCSLFSDESEDYLRYIFQQSPIQIEYPLKLELGLLASPIEVNFRSHYVIQPQSFLIKRNPTTGNSSLLLVCSTEDPDLTQRLDSLDRLNPDYPLLIALSSMVHELPRYKRAWLNSKQDFFQIEKVLLKTEGEFVEERGLFNSHIDEWPSSF